MEPSTQNGRSNELMCINIQYMRIASERQTMQANIAYLL